MRDKEVEIDYRFLPEPNLPSVVVEPQWLLNEQKMIDRKPDYVLFIEDYKIPAKDAFDIAVSKFLILLHSFFDRAGVVSYV